MHWSNPGVIRQYQNQLKVLSDGEVKRVAVRAINHAGAKSKTQVTRALAGQTGLKQAIIRKAIGSPKRATFSSLEYQMRTKGGDISLKYFRPTETRAGVKASPFGKRQLFDGHFLKSGPRRSRRVSPKLGGHVYVPTSDDKHWGRPIEGPVKSGVIIPAEMVKGETADVFDRVSGPALDARMRHELARILL